MPIPVSVTGFANTPGAQSMTAQATNCEMVSDGPFAHLAQQNAREEQKANHMQVDKPEPVIELEVSQTDSNADEPLVVVDGLDFKYPGTDTAVTVLGCPPFHTTGLERTGDLSYIGGAWV